VEDFPAGELDYRPTPECPHSAKSRATFSMPATGLIGLLLHVTKISPAISASAWNA